MFVVEGEFQIGDALLRRDQLQHLGGPAANRGLVVPEEFAHFRLGGCPHGEDGILGGIQFSVVISPTMATTARGSLLFPRCSTTSLRPSLFFRSRT